MNRKSFTSKLQTITGFLLFALAYYSPFLLDSSGFDAPDTQVNALLSEALATPAIQIGLLRTAATHLVLLILCYSAVLWIADQVARSTQLHRGVARLVFLLTAWLTLVYGNGLLFPLSNYSFTLNTPGFPLIARVGGLILACGAVAALAKAAWSKRQVFGIVLVGIIGISLGASYWIRPAQATNAAKRNVIIVGIDSLSDQMATAMLPNLPHLAALLDRSERFKRAYTPLGRTFPAWTLILGGESPAASGALFNLRSLGHVHTKRLVTDELRKNGYQTAFAMDERRFSNMDESFGFDHVVGPKDGALDFILQRVNDTPLTNLLLQTPVAHYLLPYSRLNVDSDINYDAKGFVDATLAAPTGAKPLFLAVHFETAHFPFKTRHATHVFHDSNMFVAEQKTALTVVDAQIGRLMKGLGRRGYLNDALVIVLSDHGEGLGELEATTTRDGKPYQVKAYGHGADLMSEGENRIVLGLLRFQGGKPVNAHSTRSDQVSLLDLRAVIERYVHDGQVQLPKHDGCVLVETGIRFLAAASYKGLDREKLADEAAGYYAIDSAGRLHLREDRLPELVATKDVGWRCHDELTFWSNADQRYFAYRLLDDGTRLVETAPAADDIARIEAYRNELKSSVGG